MEYYKPKLPDATRPAAGVSRRQFIQQAASALVSAALPGCVEISDYYNRPGLRDYMKNQETISGYMAAGTVLIAKSSSRNPKLKSLGYIGHGGLFEKDGKIWLMSVNHVKNLFEENDHMIAVFPGVNRQPFIKEVPGLKKQPEIFSDDIDIFYVRGKDNIIGYPLPQTDDELHHRLSEGKIKPLTIKTQQPRIGEPLGIVDATGDLTRLVYAENQYGIRYFKIWLMGRTCIGQSGSPILELNHLGNPTGRSYGLFQSQSASHPGCVNDYGGYIPFK